MRTFTVFGSYTQKEWEYGKMDQYLSSFSNVQSIIIYSDLRTKEVCFRIIRFQN
jgi:hypothetical protein